MTINRKTKIKIKDLPNYDRPREKMIDRGPCALANDELMAVLLGSGSKGRDVFSVSRDIARKAEEDFSGLTIEKLITINGIGRAKACQIVAAIEFSKRFLIKKGVRIINDIDVLPLVQELRFKKQECLMTFTLDGGNYLIRKRTVFVGTLDQTFIHPREIFADAICDRAASLVCVHNHTSIDAYPSEEDIKVTNRLLDVGKMLGISLLDHIIVTQKESFSFKNKGLLNR